MSLLRTEIITAHDTSGICERLVAPFSNIGKRLPRDPLTVKLRSVHSEAAHNMLLRPPPAYVACVLRRMVYRLLVCSLGPAAICARCAHTARGTGGMFIGKGLLIR